MKKRPIISVLTAVVTGLSVTVVPLSAELPTAIVAEAATNGPFEYSVSNGTVTIEKYLGNNPSVKIPSKINGYKVTKIADRAFAVSVKMQTKPEPMNISSVTFESPSYVKEIGDYAFFGAPISKLALPVSVNRIGNYAFENCNKMKSLEIKGCCSIGEGAFYNCSAMTSVKIHKDSIAGSEAFSECRSLSYVNYASASSTAAFTYTTDSQRRKMPILTQDRYARKVIGNCFGSSVAVKFIDDYITALCDYIVKTETQSWAGESWMPDAIKARQLYDWLIWHCEYDDGVEQVAYDNTLDNDVLYTSVFLSYGLNQRGEGVGEAVCNGFAKAYSMLLRRANIESYVIKDSTAPGVKPTISHAWNLIKIDGKYYQCDATWDNSQTHDHPSDNYIAHIATSYHYFLKSDAQMKSLHDNMFTSPVLSIEDSKYNSLLQVDEATGKQALTKCNNNYADTNEDGILDNDFDLNGVYNKTADSKIQNKICQGFGLPTSVINNNYLPIWMNNLRVTEKSPSQYLYYYFNI